jgi:hypothetical protein
MFALVALGAAYQAFFGGDFPAYPSRKTTISFIGILAALGALLHLLPGHGIRTNQAFHFQSCCPHRTLASSETQPIREFPATVPTPQ